MSNSASVPATQKLTELGLQLSPDINYRYETLFPKTEGWGAKSHIRKKHKQISRIESRLSHMLLPGEEVLYVAHGVQYKFSEHYFMGWLALLINQTVFVLTNVRLLLIHANTRGAPKETYWAVYYNQIKDFKPSWTGNTKLNLLDGSKFTFTGFDKHDRKQMPTIFQQALTTYQQMGFQPEVTQSRENLCSHCFLVVPKHEYTCPHCQAEYWTPKEIALRSLLLPSWGDFLMRHTSAAFMELLSYFIMWFVVFAIMTGAIDDGDANALPIAGLICAGIVAGHHIVDAILTYYIAKKGLTPREAPKL